MPPFSPDAPLRVEVQASEVSAICHVSQKTDDGARRMQAAFSDGAQRIGLGIGSAEAGIKCLGRHHRGLEHHVLGIVMRPVFM